MMEPPPDFLMCGKTARESNHTERTFRLKVSSHCSSVICSAVPTCKTPALFTRTFRPPNRCTVSSSRRLISPALETSAEIAKARSPISLATLSMGSFLLPTNAMRAPSFASAIAEARPIPLPAPVTMPTLSFSRSPISNSLAELGPQGRVRARGTVRSLIPSVHTLTSIPAMRYLTDKRASLCRMRVQCGRNQICNSGDHQLHEAKNIDCSLLGAGSYCCHQWARSKRKRCPGVDSAHIGAYVFYREHRTPRTFLCRWQVGG